MHLYATLLFQLTVQTVSASSFSQIKSGHRSSLKSRVDFARPGVETRPEVVEHPVIPVVVIDSPPAQQHGNGQPNDGADSQPLSETEPGLFAILPSEGDRPHQPDEYDDWDYQVGNMLSILGIPPFGVDPFFSWITRPNGNEDLRTPALQPPASISKEYQRLPINDLSNKGKASSSRVTYTDKNSGKIQKSSQRERASEQYKKTMSERLSKLEEANVAQIKQLQDENKALKEKVIDLESRMLASWTSPVPDELSRLVASDGNYQQAGLEDYSLPIGTPLGGFTFGQPGGISDPGVPDVTTMTDEEFTYWLNHDPSDQNWVNFPPPPEPNQHQRRAQLYLHRRNRVRSTEQRQSDYISRRSDSQPDMKDPATAYKVYIAAYTQIRVNVSSLLVPYLSPILEKANNTLIYDMVRSIHSDIVAYGPWTLGPYSNGHTCFDWIEDQLFGNITDDTILKNETVMGVLANHAILINIYNEIWENATQIVNRTGYLAYMHTLRGYLNPTNTSIIPASWKSIQPQLASLSFDALYNKTLST